MGFEQLSIFSIYMSGSSFVQPPEPGRFKWVYGKYAFPVQAEVRGNNYYWYMRKMVGGQIHIVYLSPMGKLESGLLDNAARYILELASTPDKQV